MNIIFTVNDRSILYTFNRLIDYKQRNKEPFPRDDRIAKSVFNFDVQAGQLEEAMDTREPRFKLSIY